MPVLSRLPRAIVGFTLLEMMLTVGLIALTATYVTVNIGKSDSRLAVLEARRFVALVNLAQDESILTGRAMKLEFDENGHQYQFTVVDTNTHFKPARNDDDDEAESEDKDALSDHFLKARKIPASIQISFSVEPRKKKKTVAPKLVAARVHEILNESILDKASDRFGDEEDDSGVLIEPNGLMSPFTLTLTAEKKTTKIELDRYGKAAIVTAKP